MDVIVGLNNALNLFWIYGTNHMLNHTTSIHSMDKTFTTCHIYSPLVRIRDVWIHYFVHRWHQHILISFSFFHKLSLDSTHSQWLFFCMKHCLEKKIQVVAYITSNPFLEKIIFFFFIYFSFSYFKAKIHEIIDGFFGFVLFLHMK